MISTYWKVEYSLEPILDSEVGDSCGFVFVVDFSGLEALAQLTWLSGFTERAIQSVLKKSIRSGDVEKMTSFWPARVKAM